MKEKRALIQITNINALNKLDKKASFEECLQFILKQNFFRNKFIKPDTLIVLKNNNDNFTLEFENDFFKINGNTLKISYQLKLEYFILKILSSELNGDLYNHFFENDDKYGNITKNTHVEYEKSSFLDNNKYRVDFILNLTNGYKIIIEINEDAHEDEGKKINDFNRALQIINNDSKICKFYILREKFIKKKIKNIEYFMKKILIPEIKKNDSLHNERNFVISKLIQLTCDSWRPICELIYDSHLNPNDYVIYLCSLNNFFGINWEKEFVKEIDSFICHDYLSDENIFGNLPLHKQNETKKNFYNTIDGDIKLTWKGFNYYISLVINYVDINKKKMIINFHHNILTKFIDVLKEHRDNIIKNIESQKIWGDESDYDFVQ